ncbi:MAG: hypothetical protein ACREJO_11430 [Phycisphaerales bacterium]
MEAYFVSEKYQVTAAYVDENGKLVSENLKIKEDYFGEAPPPPAPPAPNAFRPIIEEAYCWSKLKCISDPTDGLYIGCGPDVPDNTATYCCRDAAWALIAWLKHALLPRYEAANRPGMVYCGITWKCANGKISGHSFVMVRTGPNPWCYYLIDPQTGETSDSMCIEGSVLTLQQQKEMIRRFMERIKARYRGWCDDGSVPQINDPILDPPDRSRWPAELPPFWRDRDPNPRRLPVDDPNNAWERFKKRLQQCCAPPPAPPSPPPQPAAPPCPRPTGVPDPCDLNSYTLP